LTPKGEWQAGVVGRFLKNKNISAIFSSPLGRCLMTSAQVSEALGLSVEVLPALREMDFGRFQGRYQKDVKNHPFFEQRVGRKLHVKFPGGESYHDVYERIRSNVLDIHSIVGEENIVIIGHESVNRIVRAIITGIPLEEAVKNKQPNNMIVRCQFGSSTETMAQVATSKFPLDQPDIDKTMRNK